MDCRCYSKQQVFHNSGKALLAFSCLDGNFEIPDLVLPTVFLYRSVSLHWILYTDMWYPSGPPCVGCSAFIADYFVFYIGPI